MLSAPLTQVTDEPEQDWTAGEHCQLQASNWTLHCWAQPLNSAIQAVLNPVHCHSPHPHFLSYEDATGDRVKSLAEVKADIHCSPLIYSASHSITTNYSRLVKHYFPSVNPHWLLLITFYFICLEVTMQDELLHHLSRDGGESDEPIVLWVLFLAFSEVTPAFLRHLCCSPWPFKDYGEWLSSNICQLPLHL